MSNLPVAALFPGQGSQYLGMGKKLSESHVGAKKILDEANSVLDFDLSDVMWNGPEEKLTAADGTLRYLRTSKIPFAAAGTEINSVLGIAVDKASAGLLKAYLGFFALLLIALAGAVAYLGLKKPAPARAPSRSRTQES